MSSEADIKEVHDQMLVLLKRFHEICMENGIKYSLHGGTLLGAIREKGFIPWDDDADISLARSEYDKLRIAMKNLDGKGDFYFCDHIHSRFQVPHFCMKQAGKPLVWVDLLIYDFISENLILQKIKIMITLFLNGFSKTDEGWEITKNRVKYAQWKKKIYHFIYMLGKPFPFEWKANLRDKFSRNCFCGRKKFVYRGNDQYIGMVIVLPSTLMLDYKTVPFENIELMILNEYHAILESSYGEDYMEPKKCGIEELIIHDTTRKILDNMIKV